MSEEKKIYSERDKVKFKNLRPWDIGFGMICQHEDVTVAGGQTMSILSVMEIEEQIQRGNVAFCGVDERGKHASFRILDPDMCRYLFGLAANSPLPEQMDEELVESLLKVKDQKKFKNMLNEIVLNDGDKRHLAYIFANRDDIDSYPGWVVKAIESKTGVKFYDQ